ncbi:hypothetical protein CVT25_002453, partial [Psilocybe cyanescens]
MVMRRGSEQRAASAAPSSGHSIDAVRIAQHEHRQPRHDLERRAEDLRDGPVEVPAEHEQVVGLVRVHTAADPPLIGEHEPLHMLTDVRRLDQEARTALEVLPRVVIVGEPLNMNGWDALHNPISPSPLTTVPPSAFWASGSNSKGGTGPAYGNEIQFGIESTRLDRLNDTYSLDIRRLKGNLRSYKSLYDTLQERADLSVFGCIMLCVSHITLHSD